MPPKRRSSRRIAAQKEVDHHGQPSPAFRGLPITAFRRPWVQHYIDIGHCRLKKCTLRIQNASEEDVGHLSISFLAMAIKASTSYGPKHRQELALIDYTRAVMARGIAPNDHDKQQGSAVAMAAYHGYCRLLKLLLDAGCPVVNDGEPDALQAAVRNSQHDCLRILLEERTEEIQAQLEKESRASWRAPKPTAMILAVRRGDVEAVRLLRDKGHAKLLLFFHTRKKQWESVFQELYPGQDVSSWKKELHWSFPGADRRMLNWMWHALKRRQNEDGPNLPSEVWLRVFGYVGRGWWDLSTLKDQNGFHDLPRSMVAS